ncbi:MAG: hypothetical protein AAFV88_17020 [Planctomycetota bacterium]
MPLFKCFSFGILLGLFFVGMNHPTAAAKPDHRPAAELLPETVVAYAEISDLGEVIELIANHPLRETVEASPVVETLQSNQDLQPVFQLVGGFETTMGMPWMQAIGSLTDRGISIAVDGATQGAVLLVGCSDEDQLARFQRFLLALTQVGSGQVEMLKQGTYRGVTAYTVSEDLRMATVGQWLVMTNQPELGKAVIDRYFDNSARSLASDGDFQAAMDAHPHATGRAFVDVDTIRSAGIAEELYRGKTENIVAEMLFGGILSNLKETPYATASLDVKMTGVTLSTQTKHDPRWEEGREYFFGGDNSPTLPPTLSLNQSLLTFRSHRDLSEMWLRAPDLMTDLANEELAQADSTLTTLFSGLDFGEDVLGALHPEQRLVVCNTSFEDQQFRPAIELPAFALEFRMRKPKETRAEFRRVFQSLIGFLNIVGAMNGQPQLDQTIEELDQATLIVGSYVAPRSGDDLETIPIIYNFSPTLAFDDDRMVISSKSSLARELLQATPQQTDETKGTNTFLSIDANELNRVLQKNRSQLVAQNMLDKGHSPAKAEAEIGLLFDVVSLFENASVMLEADDESLTLTTSVNVKTDVGK